LPSQAADGTSDPIPALARRYDAAATYDPIGDQIIVFGGVWGDGYSGNDTWAHGFSGGAAWVPKLQTEPFPPSRSGATLTYDSFRKRLVLFGGLHTSDSGHAYLNDVWVAPPSGAGWTLLAVSGTPPPPRAGHVALYDPAGDRLIVCGGTNDGPDLGDVWELRFATSPSWNELHTPSPLVRNRAAAVIDPAGSRLILFGGSVGSTTMNDTWAFSLSSPYKWTSLSPIGTPPSVREGHTAMFDATNRRMILFGGASQSYYGQNNEVWTLNLSGSPAWTQLSPSGAPPVSRAYHNALWDASRNRMVIFGGYQTVRPYYANDLWALDPSGGWSQIPDMPNPGRRSQAASFFDPVRGRLLLFGGTDGYTNYGTIWTHPLASNAPWTLLSPSGVPPSPRSGATLIYDGGRDRAVLFGGNDGSMKNDVWLLDLASNTWSQTTPSGTLPSVRESHSAVYDGSRNRMLIFGGTWQGIATLSDVWELVFSDPPVWNQLTPSGTPPTGRIGHSAILDPIRDRMIVFSGGYEGFDGGTYNNEVWALSLSGLPAWSRLTPSGTPPGGRVGHSAFYDPIRDRMMVFGGGQMLGTFIGYMFNDVWELPLSGSPTWNELHPTGVLPPQRALHAWGYDPVNATLMVFGGYQLGYGASDDAWIFHFGPGTTSVEPLSQSIALRLVASPNPVLTRTSLRFHLANREAVTLSVHDVQGRRVAVLVDRVLDPGDHEITWEPKSQSLGSGVYFYDLIAGKARTSGRLVLLR
jgi:hypothetical protein